MGLLPGSSRGNTEKAAPGDKGGVENGAGRAMVVAMPRDGAIIFSDLIGKLDPWPSRAAPELLPCAEDHRCCPVRSCRCGIEL